MDRTSSEPEMYPAFLKLAGRRVLVVGGGTVARSKIGPLLAAGAHVTVVAPEIGAAIARLPVAVARRRFRTADLDGTWFVVAAATRVVNREVAAAADLTRTFVNAVDDPASASAYAGGVFRRDGVTVAISTGGHAPALAGLLREGLDAMLPSDLAAWVRVARRIRPGWRTGSVPMTARRPHLLRALNRLYDMRTPGRAGC